MLEWLRFFAAHGHEHAQAEGVSLGDHRIGVTEWLTMGGRVEVTDRLVGVAPEVALRAPVASMSARPLPRTTSVPPNTWVRSPLPGGGFFPFRPAACDPARES